MLYSALQKFHLNNFWMIRDIGLKCTRIQWDRKIYRWTSKTLTLTFPGREGGKEEGKGNLKVLNACGIVKTCLKGFFETRTMLSRIFFAELWLFEHCYLEERVTSFVCARLSWLVFNWIGFSKTVNFEIRSGWHWVMLMPAILYFQTPSE